MRWTECARRRTCVLRTAKSCGSGAPTLALSFVRTSSHWTTVARKPGHREEHEVSRKTIAQGKPECFRLNLWSYPRAFCCTGPTGAAGTRLSLRPLYRRGWKVPQSSGAMRRENAHSHILSPHSIVMPATAGIQYSMASERKHCRSGILDRPVKPDDDSGVAV